MVLVTYDIEGVIQDIKGGSNLREPVGIPFRWVDIPEGKRLKCMDMTVTPNMPVFEYLPKSEAQILQSNMLSVEDALFTALMQVDELNIKVNGGV